MSVDNTDAHPRWHLADIAFDRIDRASVRDDEFLFLTLASASFVEILAQTYSSNLIEHFRGNREITDWLAQHWQAEEVQHGQALKAYVQAVWPEFDWERGHRAFAAEYGACCTVEQLEPQRALELLARCVVETGTSTFYRALLGYVREPVLREIIDHIKTDEAAHYTFFRRHFMLYNAIEGHGAKAAFATIWRRLREVRGEDAYIAFKHVHATRHRANPFCETDWRDFNDQVKRLARRHYPYAMAVQMLIMPVPMRASFKRLVRWPLTGLARLIMHA